jgi:hypothetical protein
MSSVHHGIAHQTAESVHSIAHVKNAIRKASVQSGIDFDYLLNQAKAESSLRPDAKAKTSSATGLFQFIDSTWMRMVKAYGHKHGLSDYAAAITQNTSNGRFEIDPSLRQDVLNLRKDPEIASAMAAELAAENKNILENALGREASPTDLYFAHFLGAGGAVNFLKQHQDTPNREAAITFPKAANANKAIFYDRDTGVAKSFDQIYAHFERKIEGSHQAQPSTPLRQSDDHYLSHQPRSGVQSNTSKILAFQATQNQQHQLLNALLALSGPDSAGVGSSLSAAFGSDHYQQASLGHKAFSLMNQYL